MFVRNDIIDVNDFISRNMKINFNVKIHNMATCECRRIQNVCWYVNSKNININIVYVIERTWSDYNTNYPKFIYIVREESVVNNDEYCVAQLRKLFAQTCHIRNDIYNYFKNYIWDNHKSKLIRKSLAVNKSIGYCFSDLKYNINKANAGLVLVGTFLQMQKIANIFNNHSRKTEFESIQSIRIGQINKCKNTSFSLQILAKLCSDKIIDNKFYTLIGYDKFRGEHTTSFGKREWYDTDTETSLICARRELYEELNIQISDNLLKKQDEINELKEYYIPHEGIILYFVYLIKGRTKIEYYNDSDTIYLNI